MKRKKERKKKKILITWAMVGAGFGGKGCMKGFLGWRVSPALLQYLFELLESYARKLLLLALHVLLVFFAELHVFPRMNCPRNRNGNTESEGVWERKNKKCDFGLRCRIETFSLYPILNTCIPPFPYANTNSLTL